jgi:hypothetical protein
MRLADHGSEGDNEELVDMQAVFEVARRSEGSHDTGRVITRLDEVVYRGAIKSTT